MKLYLVSLKNNKLLVEEHEAEERSKTYWIESSRTIVRKDNIGKVRFGKVWSLSPENGMESLEKSMQEELKSLDETIKELKEKIKELSRYKKVKH